MPWSRALGSGWVVLAVALAVGDAARAQTGIVAISGETLHQMPDALIGFGAGRAVSLAPHFGALVRHGAGDDEIVLLVRETGAVRTADESLADLVLYDEAGIGRDVAKLLSEPGGVLLFETPTGSSDPESTRLARLSTPSGETLTLYFDRGVAALPEPGRPAGLAAGAALLRALDRRRRRWR